MKLETKVLLDGGVIALIGIVWNLGFLFLGVIIMFISLIIEMVRVNDRR